MSDIERAPQLDKAVKIPVTLFPDQVRGLEALAHWLRGFEATGNGRVAGHFELVMHIRELQRAYLQSLSDLAAWPTPGGEQP